MCRLLLVTFLLFLSGCATTDSFYSGEIKSPDELATIVSKYTPVITVAGHLKLNLVDGEHPRSLWNWSAYRWEVLPGKRDFTFQVNIPGKVGVKSVVFTVEAGKMYYASPVIDYKNMSFDVDIKEVSPDFFEPEKS